MIENICQTANGKSNKNGTLMDQKNECSLNHGLGIGAAVGVAGWQDLIVGLYVMQRHGVPSKAYMGRNVGPLLYLTKLDVKYHHLRMDDERSLNHGLGIGAVVGVAG